MNRRSYDDVFLYGDATDDLDLDTLHIEPIRDRSLRHDWVIHPHRHPHHVQLLLFTEGGATIRIEDTVLSPVGGTIAVHPAGMVHDIRYAPMTEGLTITVASSYVDLLCKDTPEVGTFLTTPAVIGLEDRTDTVTAAFRAIAAEQSDRQAHWKLATRGHFLTVLATLSRLAQAPVSGRIPRDRQLAQAFRNLLETRFRSEKRMTEYAGLLAISPQRLNAACNSATGQSASDILHDRIMVEARRSLAYTEMTVAEVGIDLGFDDPAYFNRFFSKRAGLPPGEWRARFAATEIPAKSVE